MADYSTLQQQAAASSSKQQQAAASSNNRHTSISMRKNGSLDSLEAEVSNIWSGLL
jgi:hypothetical protein